MAKVLNLYNHNVHPIGTATWDSAKCGYSIAYNDDVHYGDVFVPYEEFETYKADMGLNSMAGTQVTLKDFLL